MRKKTNKSSVIKKTLYIIILEILLTCFLFMSVEGFLSWYHFFRDIYHNKNIQTTNYNHTQYDSLLGWKNIPNTYIQNIFGPNASLTITADGFRKTPINPNSQSLKTICSGDSFTFGYGVDDSKNWCSLLSKDLLQTINMGQAGYGLDQTYLWYQRDAANISHAIHIMAFIPDDFERVSTNEYFGYDKPFFKIKNGNLINTNFPIPIKRNLNRFVSNNQNIFDNLHLFLTINHIKQLFTHNIYPQINEVSNKSEQETVVSAILENLVKLTYERGATPFIVLLPTRYSSDNQNTYMERYNKWKNLITRVSEKNNVTLIDMGKIFFNFDTTEYSSLFINNDLHYTEATNVLVAQNIKSAINQYLANDSKYNFR